MNYGLYLSAGGALSSMYRQDVLANNLANMNTTAFKPDRVTTRERLPERLEGSV
ncbi:MAG: flagellar biosynthesis protein FlgF, partial [Phycisphaerae bacterium]|nr:flagellar biosynthesis protein FlgF [Phycisphaerae bacterium]